MYTKFFKRFLDLLLSVSALIVAFLPLAIIALILVIDSPGPVFFKQKRVGKNKVHFNIYKLRSMPVKTPSDVPTHLLQNPDEFLSKFQKFIRKTSIDELPQLINIIRGDMSIVGPRPALWNQFDLIELRDQYGVNDIRPGLTGLAQIRGRDELELDVKAAYDGEYASNISFLQDVKCIIFTALSVLRSDGVVEGGTGAMEKENEKEKETAINK